MKTWNNHYDIILTHLKSNPYRTTKFLHHILEKENNSSLSQAQAYNIINRMVEEWMLVKESWLLSLSMKWIQQLDQFVQDAYIKYSHVLNIPLWWSKTYSANSFSGLDSIWSDISSKLSQLSQGDIYYYDPHPYHILWKTDQEEFNVKKFLKPWRSMFYVLGNTTFLDTYWAQLLEKYWCTVSMSTLWNPIFYASIWDYWYTVEHASHINEYFETFFLLTKSFDEFNKKLFQKTFHIKWTCTLTVYHDPEKSQEIANKILSHSL